MKFSKTKVAKEEFCGATKKPVKTWDVNVDNIFISKLVETKNNSKYLTGYLDDIIRQLVLILPKMSGCIKRFDYKGGDKSKNNKLMSLHIDDDQLLEKYKTV